MDDEMHDDTMAETVFTGLFEEHYRENPRRMEWYSIALAATELICGEMRRQNVSRKKMRRRVGWSKKKMRRVLDMKKITLKQFCRLLFALRMRGHLSIRAIPKNLRKAAKLGDPGR